MTTLRVRTDGVRLDGSEAACSSVANLPGLRLDEDMPRMVLVALGGLLGSMGRYWLSGVVQEWADSEFPFGTLTVNLAGSFLIGLVMALSLDRGVIGADTRTFLTVGFCGGFTTMSSFSYETLALIREGAVLAAGANAVASVVVCVVAVWVGMAVGRVV